MPEMHTEHLELTTAAVSLFLFLSSEVLSMSKCNANGIGDLLGQALRAMHGRYTNTSMAQETTHTATV